MLVAKLVTIRKPFSAVHCFDRTSTHIAPFTSSCVFAAARWRVAFIVMACLAQACSRQLYFNIFDSAPVFKIAVTIFHITLMRSGFLAF